ncbi:MAG: deoxyuridine 5'-triphosphate nucleotidohydrolase [Candidatus Aenigmatarchaeota archaeon]
MLNKDEIIQLIEKKDLIRDCPHLETQIQPNGFDITVDKIFTFSEPGKLDFSNSERKIPDCEEVEPEKKSEDDKYGWWKLEQGVYKVRCNEKFKMPKDLAAICFPRSSLLRMGCFTHTGVWDAGFEGMAEFVLFVENKEGVEIKENARIAQLVFLPVEEVEEGYSGVYKETGD